MNAEIDRLLLQSMQAHESAKSARRTKSSSATSMLATARRLRKEALALDPKREDEAWDIENIRLGKDLHEALLDFYVRQLGDE